MHYDVTGCRICSSSIIGRQGHRSRQGDGNCIIVAWLGVRDNGIVLTTTALSVLNISNVYYHLITSLSEDYTGIDGDCRNLTRLGIRGQDTEVDNQFVTTTEVLGIVVITLVDHRLRQCGLSINR